VTTRRVFLKSVPIVAATTVLPAKSADLDSPEYHIGRLAQSLKAMHGGEWKVNINHNSKIAMVVKV
jgi:hypothetical protein